MLARRLYPIAKRLTEDIRKVRVAEGCSQGFFPDKKVMWRGTGNRSPVERGSPVIVFVTLKVAPRDAETIAIGDISY